MVDDDTIWLIVGDLGWGMMDRIKEDFPNRFLNVGASEQAGMGISAGLALSGQRPFFYSITTFLLYRPFEWIRNYLQHEGIPVRLVGSGWQDDYKHDGITHQPLEGWDVLQLFPRISCFWPDKKEQVASCLRTMLQMDQPSFLCLRR